MTIDSNSHSHKTEKKNITKTCLYYFDPLKPHFYIVKLGFTGVNIIFLISAQKHKLWVIFRTASARRFWRVPTIYVLSRNMKNIRVFYLKIFSFWRWNFSIYLNRRVFVMKQKKLDSYFLRDTLVNYNQPGLISDHQWPWYKVSKIPEWAHRLQRTRNINYI